jgi:hypothetical protein
VACCCVLSHRHAARIVLVHSCSVVVQAVASFHLPRALSMARPNSARCFCIRISLINRHKGERILRARYPSATASQPAALIKMVVGPSTVTHLAAPFVPTGPGIYSTPDCLGTRRGCRGSQLEAQKQHWSACCACNSRCPVLTRVGFGSPVLLSPLSRSGLVRCYASFSF